MTIAHPRPAEPDSPYAALRLIVTLVLMMIGASGMYVVAVVLPAVQAEFGVARDNGAEAVVNVEVEGESGRVVQYQYLLRKEEGVWKISGVVEVRPKGTVA